ncbi:MULTISPECIES: LamG domain-containing protein [unclassified Lentimonas]|uniref:LamG domain-containing protein n=1 Tax=unclassified Lentimonas TaxID=2630993 RepID=UPI001389C8ED|nr:MULTISPECIES: LamG domain-containing protein [unclassified Lentimonas]
MKYIRSCMLCTSLFVGIYAQANTYVSTSGSDSNPGTLAAPFATIQHAVNQSVPGDSVLIRGGSYHEAVDLSGIAGTAARPIKITNYQSEEVVLDGRVEIETAWTLETRNSVNLPAGNDTPSANIPGIGNVYVTTLPNSVGDITQLFVDDEVMTLARFPNALAFSDEVWGNEKYLFKSAPTHGTAVDQPQSGADNVADSGVSFTGCVMVSGSARVITAHATGDAEFTHNAPLRLESGTTPYFLEGGLDNAERIMLDIAQEWAYDESTNKLTFWPKNNANPNNLNVYGKNQIYAFTGDATTQHVNFDGLNFFATTVDFNFSDNITIQNCDFDYYSSTERAVASEDQAKTTDFTGGSTDFCKGIRVYNCEFRYATDTGLIANYIDGLTIENCLFHKITHYQINDRDEYGNRRALHVVDTNNAMDIVYRRNTVSYSSALQSVRLRRYVNADEIHPFVAEYNFHTECCLLGGDASTLYSPLEHVQESVSRYNWFMENQRRDFRWDGLNAGVVGTLDGNLYRNVSHSIKYSHRDHAYRLKGDGHEVYHNIAVGEYSNFNVAQDKGGNPTTVSQNNAADVLTSIVEQSIEPDYFAAGGDWDLNDSQRGENDWGLSGIDSYNYSPSFTDHTRSMHDLLRDPDNWDFRPRADAVELIDQGVPITCTIDGVEVNVTEGYLGSAPDIGAYEYGDSAYWIPGRQEEQASMPVPRTGRGSVPLDTDLMYLIGLNGVSANIYFGTNPNSLSLLTSKTDPENIVTLSDHTTLNNNTTYYWRVDTVMPSRRVITGDVWSFNTPFTPLANKEILPWTSNSIQNGYWSEDADGELVYNNSGSQFYKRAIAYSSAAQQSDTGFRLTAYYRTASIGDVLAHNLSFGIISTDTDLSTYSGYNPFKVDTSVYSLGVNLTENGGNDAQGLTFTDGSTRTTLDRSGDYIQFPVNESTEVVIEILPGGHWSYSINGVTEASGVIEGGFDLTKSYRVAVYAQDDSGGEKSIQHLSLDKIASGLIADWSMDENSGVNIADDSGNNFDASSVNGTRVAGIEGKAIAFNGSSSSVTLPTEPFYYLNNEVTMAFWVYGDTTQARADTLFYAQDDSGNRVMNIHLPWSDGSVYWDAGNTGSNYDRINKVATASEYKDQWNHWVFTKNAATGEMAIYLNGYLWLSGTGKTRNMVGIASALLGNDLKNNAYAGIIDEVKLYNVALSASEVLDLSYSYKTINGTPRAWLVSYGFDPTNAGSEEDADGDGIANWQEYQDGTDPTVNDNPVSNTGAGIRVTEYYLTTGDFTGTSKTLVLDQNLADDYFILVRGSRDGDGGSLPDNDFARVTGVPWGANRYAGDMVGSGSGDRIILTRSVATYDWEGVVTVVECTNPSSPAGFDLVDVAAVDISGNSGSEASIAWSDINQVVLFGGYRGGGVSYTGTPSSGYDNVSAYTRFYPSGSNTISWNRNSAGETLLDVTATTFVVEWGSEWNIQRRKVTGSNGGNGANATGEYTTVAISPVSRDNTWVWGTGTRLDSGVGDGAEGCLVTLGDGVNQNATESTVAVGSEYTDTYWFDVYTLTHPDLNVDHRFKADGDSGSSDLAVTVDSAASGTRFGWVYNGCNGTGTSVSRAKLWSRYTNDNEVTISRGNSGQNFPAWIQGIDFSDLNN